MILGTWYKWLWSHTTKRPYTYIIRDFYHELPFPFMMVFAGIVWVFQKYFHASVREWVYIAIGVLIGHLFWGRDYIPDEGEIKTYGYKGVPKNGSS